MDNMDLHTILTEFERSSLAELELTCAAYTIKLKRLAKSENPGVCAIATPAPIDQKHVEKPSGTTIITSPIVGTFYLTPAPDAPPYVEIGDHVETGAVMCTIEAMKMMNQLEAEYPCEIVTVLAPQGSLVEFGQPLFEVKRR